MHTATAALMNPTPDAKQAFVDLLNQHIGIIRKVAVGYSSTLADRHDLEQEITLQLWKAYPRYSPERPFSTWMYRIALNVAISFLRSNSRPVRQTIPIEEIELADEADASPEMRERLALLQKVIATLDPLNRALMLLFLDDHSYREIAAILSITETNVATKLSRLKQRLRDEMLKLDQQNT